MLRKLGTEKMDEQLVADGDSITPSIRSDPDLNCKLSTAVVHQSL